MARTLAAVTLLVPDYDAALAWFTGTLGFVCLEDTDLGGGKRWVRVAAAAESETHLLLARAAAPAQAAALGRQAGGRVFLFLRTDDFAAEHARLSAAGVRFAEAPRREPYGMVAVFEDPFGNRWDLLGPAT